MYCFLIFIYIYMIFHLFLTNSLKLSKLLKSFPFILFFIFLYIFFFELKSEECRDQNSISISLSWYHSKFFIKKYVQDHCPCIIRNILHIFHKFLVNFLLHFDRIIWIHICLKKSMTSFLLLYYAPYTLRILFHSFCCSSWNSSPWKHILKNEVSFCKIEIHLCMLWE